MTAASIWLLCSLKLTECVESDFELRNDSTFFNGSGGYLRVCVNGVWSAICGDGYGWDVNDATVACRQLGMINEISSKNDNVCVYLYLPAECTERTRVH